MAFRRYENSRTHTKINRRGIKNNKMYNISSFKTVHYGVIPKSDNDIYVITQDGDRLDLLANQFYGDVNLWWYIAKANGLKFMTIAPVTSLRIPGSTDYAVGI